MDSSSAYGENLNPKTRKPYTITKQREKWTEEEHNSFLEALKLYGRAWQRIEEHIGTKTAVQIRSHAQKFFTKLEKEAVAKGVPISQALDMEIPPPRPKRKPNYPYPRKTDLKTRTQVAEKEETQATVVSSLQVMDLERKPLPETYPRHVPVQLEDGNQENTTKTSVPPDISLHESKVSSGNIFEHPNPNLSVNTATAAGINGHHTNATLHPLFNPFSDNQESYRSFLHFSSTISSLIVSSLLQNPAAHAAASFAAKFWHPVNTEASSAHSFSRDQLNPASSTPSMTAIAAATVAAAAAWWSTHGLLPVCTPFYQGGYSRTFGTPVDGNLVNCGSDKAPSEGVLQDENMDAEKAESAEDLPSSEDSEKKLNTEVVLVDTNEATPVGELNDSSKLTNVKKQVDRSSSGSNTISSSEIETDALEKHVKEMEENKGTDVKESNSRRGRSTVTPTESWKEVSEEGRLAFQALFSREVLPQSFCDSHTIAGKDQQNIVRNSELDLNSMSHEPGESNSSDFLVLRGEEDVPRMGLGSVKLNVLSYRRCSVEANENSKIMSATSTGGGQNDEKDPKRMCFETEAST